MMQTSNDRDTVPRYTMELRDEVRRTGMKVRGRGSIEEQSGLDATRIHELLNGGEPTDREHRQLCRALARMKHYSPLLLEFRKQDVAPAPPMPPSPVLVRVVPKRPVVLDAPPPSQPPQSEETTIDRPTDPATAVTFGSALLHVREADGMLQREVAELCGVMQGSYSRWERDDGAPTAENYAKLCELFPVLVELPKPEGMKYEQPRSNAHKEAQVEVPEVPVTAVPQVVFELPKPVEAKPLDRTRALISLGAQLAAFRVAIGSKYAPTFAKLLRTAEAAGVDCATIADAIESES